MTTVKRPDDDDDAQAVAPIPPHRYLGLPPTKPPNEQEKHLHGAPRRALIALRQVGVFHRRGGDWTSRHERAGLPDYRFRNVTIEVLVERGLASVEAQFEMFAGFEVPLSACYLTDDGREVLRCIR